MGQEVRNPARRADDQRRGRALTAFVSLVLAVSGLLALGIAWLTASRVVAISGIALALAGMLGIGFVAVQIHVASDGDTSLFRFLQDPATAGSRSMHYSDPTAQKLLKDSLTRAGIPFRTRTREGREHVVWEQQHDAAAEKVYQAARWEAVRAGIPLNPRASFIDPALQKEFIAWLEKRGVKYDTFKLDGRDTVAWELRSDTANLMDVFMAEGKRN